MKIYRPTRTNHKTQGFGESNACIDIDNKVKTKVNGVCIDSIELYPALGLKGHNGEDWRTYRGEPIYFPADFPKVEWKAKSESDYHGGIGVDVYSDKEVLIKGNYKGLVKNHPEGYFGYVKLRFWHLQKIDIYDGKPIKFGDRIGFADNTGLSSGDHLHWAIKMCDITGRGINQNNGYYGAFEFPFFENRFTLDVLNIKIGMMKEVVELLKKIIFLMSRA